MTQALSLLAALVASAWADPVATVVAVAGSNVRWKPECVEDANLRPYPERCRAAASLSYAHYDAWRMALAWSGASGVDRILLFVEDAHELPQLPGVEPVGPPSGAGIVDSLKAYVVHGQLPPGDVEVVLYLAGHGTGDGVDLSDGRWDGGELRRAVEEIGGPQHRLKVVRIIADVCSSALWRRSLPYGQQVTYDPVVDERRGYDAVLSSRETQEFVELQGGMLTYLTIGGFLGAGDLDGDGTVQPQELSNYLSAYEARLGGSISPQVVAPAPERWSTDLSPAGDAGLLLRSVPPVEGGRADLSGSRWLVMVEWPGEKWLPFTEVWTGRGEAVDLSLPPGRYALWRVDYSRQDRAAGWEREDLFIGRVWYVDLQRGQLFEPAVADAKRRPIPFAGLAPRGDADGEEGRVTPDAGAVGQLLSSHLAVAVPQEVPRGGFMWHGAKTWLSLSGGLSTALLGRSEPLLGGSVAVRYFWPRGRLRTGLALENWTQATGVRSSTLVAVAGRGEVDVALVASRRAWAGAGLDLRAGGLVLESLAIDSAPLRGSPMLGAGVGPTAGLRLGDWGVGLRGRWDQDSVLVRGSEREEGRVWVTEFGRWAVGLSADRRL